MKPKLRNANRCLPRKQRGQSMIEYAVICTALAAALFVPIPPTQQAAGELLASKIHDLYTYLTFFISLP
ncbi:conserved exported hypothetical protein [Burkholderiales bacterium]|nr:conserved exported hypothetical protein [Burkholderiales bacterium]